MSENTLRKLNLDALGIGASLLCALHCALLPLLITALPLLGLEMLENEKLEYGLMGVSFFVGCTALVRGYRHHHHHIRPLLLFTAGFVLLLLGHFVMEHHWEPLTIALGALLIVAAHLLNLRECRRCKICNHKEL